MPEMNRPPRIDSIQFGDHAVVISYMSPENVYPDGGSLAETMVIPLAGIEDEVNELLDDALTILDAYLTHRRGPAKTIRGRE